ncbi:MAG TPA: hypothetical protein VF100_01175 [Thermoanaerobaculia bacterium]
MERLARAERAIQTVVTAGLVAGAQFQQESLVDFLRSFLGGTAAGGVVYSFAMVVIAAVFYLIGVAADQFFEHVTWARRLVLRDQFVEGCWIDAVIAPGKELSGGIVRIFYRDGEMKISGTTYDRRGKRIGPFSSKHSMFCDNDLVYVYTKDRQAGGGSESHGFGTYTFKPSESWSPTELDGFFSSRDSAHDWRVHGRKLEDAPPRNVEIEGDFVRRFLDDYERTSALESAGREPEAARG